MAAPYFWPGPGFTMLLFAYTLGALLAVGSSQGQRPLGWLIDRPTPSKGTTRCLT